MLSDKEQPQMKKPLPVKGYTDQSDENIALVNEFKIDEERLLRKIDKMAPRQYAKTDPITGAAVAADEPAKYDQRWLAVARTHIQEGFMALNRAVFQPKRIDLEDEPADENAPSVVRAAAAAHEVNRVYCASIGDNSQPLWDLAPQWQKESAINGVLYVMNNPNSTPRNSHANWWEHKVQDGWKFGPVKDPIKKEHPCMVPYDELPPEQRLKDELFQATVRAVLGIAQ